MTDLREVDGVEILVLVDNATDNLSSTGAFVETEVTRLERRGGRIVTGDGLCLAAHGLACLVTVTRGDRRWTVLFDAGPSGQVFANNVQRLDAALHRVEAVVLSHGHWDHAGGLLRAFDLIHAAGSDHPIPFFGHPDMFHQRAERRCDGSFRPKPDVPPVRALRQHGAEPVITTDPVLAADGHLLVSGEIPRTTPFETGLPGQHRRTGPDAAWEPDEALLDERFLAAHVSGKGLVVLTACSHAGVVNVLRHATASCPGTGVHAVLGGFHLAGTNERVIPETVAELVGFEVAIIAPGHCTGWRALGALREAVGDDALVPMSVGKRFTI